MNINRNLYKDKKTILHYMRDRSSESFGEICKIYGVKDYKKRATAINNEIKKSTHKLKSIILQRSNSQDWSQIDIINNILMITYCSYVTMIEYRNRVWPYEYMAFSRRIGELWEPFCINCFNFPVRNDIELYEPPLFSDVRKQLQQEIRKYINKLNLTKDEKSQLLNYYDKVWSLVTSGEIKLELDLHFKISNKNFNVDFKSGFQSNEKGNTNRLLLVASIYKNIINANNECLLFVRANEYENNHYLQTLKNSGIWKVFCGNETYEQIKKYSGFDLSLWINNHVQWEQDLDEETLTHFHNNDLVKYLSW
ncbi:MAG: hypothetical protein D3909_05060 [Candidatus Electrothrix sp. ATG1]|nr:hypothetical protein [Candidatus Electrothrix sp. ATG1]